MRIGQLWRRKQITFRDIIEDRYVVGITNLFTRKYDKREYIDKKGKQKIEYVYANDDMVSFVYLPAYQHLVSRGSEEYCVVRPYFLMNFEPFNEIE